jgi:hypothetical protein
MRKISGLLVLLIVGFSAFAQNTSDKHKQPDADKYIENGLISLAGKDGVTWQTRSGDFLFKPYTLIQTRGIFNYYDDEGLDLAEQDNVLNTGFEIPYALVGFAGKAFNKITFNVAINAAASGAVLLNQAWFDVNLRDELRFRIGKFKTPFNQAFLVQNGQTLFPILPASLTTRVNLPYDINSVNPKLSTGFDIGVQMHGLLNKKLEYQLGIFNGTGIDVNTATGTLGDDNGLPALLYMGRLAYMPWGAMPQHQGDPSNLDKKALLVAASAGYGVEANYESSNDFHAGFECSLLYKRWFFSGEAYLLNMDFVERQKVSPVYSFWGSYLQAGYFLNKKIQPAVRIDVMDRNSVSNKGILYMPAAGLNYYLSGHNLKMQAMYQYLGKAGHSSVSLANDDDNGMSEHQFCLQFQFAF